MREGRRLARRDFLKLAGIAALDILLLAIGSAGYGFLMEPNWFKVETVRLKENVQAALNGDAQALAQVNTWASETRARFDSLMVDNDYDLWGMSPPSCH